MAKHHGHLTSEEKKEIREGRKKLRKDLKLIGITSRKEFEEIAQYLGLVYGDDYPALLWLWWRFKGWFLGWKKWLYPLLAFLVLGITFLFSVIANQKGNFLVTMSTTIAQSGLILSDREDLSNKKITVKSEVLKEVNPYSIQDIPYNVDTDYEGSHNLDNVVCYTFWVTNIGNKALNTDWYLLFNKSTRNVDQATWLMLFEDGEMTLYSRPSTKEENKPEVLKSFDRPFFMELCAHPEKQYKEVGGQWEIEAVPYAKERIVAEGHFKNLAPNEVHKFTAVIWVDGDDPDCSDALIGGHAGYSMKFVGEDEQDEIYTKYGGRLEDPEDLERGGLGGVLGGIWDRLNMRGCFGRKMK